METPHFPPNLFKKDAAKMVRHMRYCTNLEKGDPNMSETALNCKKEVRLPRLPPPPIPRNLPPFL